jgi:DNA (cytosine-5)-methyltransferase 1
MAIVHRNTVNPMRHNEPTRPIAVDLFAGAGGMSLGFEQAGFRVAAAVEIDPIHACVHKFNFPDCTVIPRSVRDLTGQMIRETAGIRGKVEVVCGGAPCQGFSLIGKRILDDPRNSLVKDFVRIVSELDAEYFVFENVKGLTVGTHRRFLDELIESFKEIGYSVRLPWAVLNAVSYGVPQDRKRLFLLGSKMKIKRHNPSVPVMLLTSILTPDLLNNIETTLENRDTCESKLNILPKRLIEIVQSRI